MFQLCRLLRWQQLLVLLELVDRHRGQLLVQLQLSLGQLRQVDHHQQVLEFKKIAISIGYHLITDTKNKEFCTGIIVNNSLVVTPPPHTKYERNVHRIERTERKCLRVQYVNLGDFATRVPFDKLTGLTSRSPDRGWVKK